MTMRMAVAFWLVAVLSVVGAAAADDISVWGSPDRVLGATLLVPFFEVGVEPATHPHDTLLTVANWSGVPIQVHWEAWDRDGNSTENTWGNQAIGSHGTWSASMRQLIASLASADDRAAFSAGSAAYYRGFVTIDVVLEPTGDTPFAAGYPFSASNVLQGSIYYVRLAQGSANGIDMIPLEDTGPDADIYLTGFYDSGTREEIDANARACAAQLVNTPSITSCDGDTADTDIREIASRVYLDSALNGTSRIVVFAWNTYRRTGGPSAICDTQGCDETYQYVRYRENGTVAENKTIRLDHVVNVIDVTGSSGAGMVRIYDIPDPDISTQIYAFSFNTAKPADATLNWDAIFESFILP